MNQIFTGMGLAFVGTWLIAPGLLQPPSQPTANAISAPVSTPAPSAAIAPLPLPTPAPLPVVTPAPPPTMPDGDAAVQSVVLIKDAAGWKLNQADLGMTAAHMVGRVGQRGTAKTNDGKHCSFTVIKTSQELDLSLLRLEGDCAAMPGLPITSDVKVGDPVTAIGFPSVFGGKLTIKQGTVKALDTISVLGSPDVEVSDQTLYAGMSGGPCFNEKGVFGVVSNGNNPAGQIRPGDRGWCAEIPEGWTKE